MTAPFRDELTAALEHAEQLETENEELRARVHASAPPADSSAALAKLQRELDELKEQNMELLARNMDLEQKVAAAGDAWPTWKVVVAIVIAVVLSLFARR